MKYHLIELGIGFGAGFLIIPISTMLGAANLAGLSGWIWIIIFDLAAFLIYVRVRPKQHPQPLSWWNYLASFLLFTIGVMLSGFIVALIIVNRFEHSSGLFLL